MRYDFEAILRILNRNFTGNFKVTKLKKTATTSGRVTLAFVILVISIFILYYFSGLAFIVLTILLGVFIFSNTESKGADYKCSGSDDDDEPKGDGYRDGPEGYGYYSGGVRDDE